MTSESHLLTVAVVHHPQRQARGRCSCGETTTIAGPEASTADVEAWHRQHREAQR